MEVILKYNNPIYPEKSLLAIGKWMEGGKIKIVYIDPVTGRKEVKRRIYFDGHDLYVTIQNTRYYFSEFYLT